MNYCRPLPLAGVGQGPVWRSAAKTDGKGEGVGHKVPHLPIVSLRSSMGPFLLPQAGEDEGRFRWNND